MDIANLPRPVGFVLGGGGSLGAVQVGMLQALSEHGIAPDLVAGTSIGSINGAVVALDPKGAANRLSHAWPKMKREHILPGGPIEQARTLRRTKTHLFPNKGLASVISDFLGEDTDLRRPRVAVRRGHHGRGHSPTSCNSRGEASPRALGELSHPRGLASHRAPGPSPLRRWRCGQRSTASSPGHGGRVPGGPGLRLRRPAPRDARVNRRGAALHRVVTMRAQAVLEAPLVAATIPVVYLPGPDPRPMSTLDFDHTPELIEASYEVARSFLEHLVIAGPGLYGSPSSR